MAEIQFLSYASYSDGSVVNVTNQSDWLTGTFASGVADWVNPYGLATTIPLVPPTGGVEGTYVTGAFLYAWQSFGQALTNPSGPGVGNAGYVSEYWEIHTPQGGDVQLVLRGDTDLFWPSSSIDPFGLDTRMWLYDQSGLCIYYNDDVELQEGDALPQGKPAFQGVWSWMSTSLAPATTYYIEVSAYYTGYYYGYHLQFVPDIGVTATLQEVLPTPFIQAPPVITEVNPNSLAMGAGAVAAALTGSGFQLGLSMEFVLDPNDPNAPYTAYPNVTYVGPTNVEFNTPATVTYSGTYGIKVINPDAQEYTLSGAFSYLPRGQIYNVWGSFGHFAAGQLFEYQLSRGSEFLLSATFPRRIISAVFYPSTNSFSYPYKPLETIITGADGYWFNAESWASSTDDRGWLMVTASIPLDYSPSGGWDKGLGFQSGIASFGNYLSLYVKDEAGIITPHYASFIIASSSFGLLTKSDGVFTTYSGTQVHSTATVTNAPQGWCAVAWTGTAFPNLSSYPRTLPVHVITGAYYNTGSGYNQGNPSTGTYWYVNDTLTGVDKTIPRPAGYSANYYRLTDYAGSGSAAKTGSSYGIIFTVSGNIIPYNSRTFAIYLDSTATNHVVPHPGVDEVYGVRTTWGTGGGNVRECYVLVKG